MKVFPSSMVWNSWVLLRVYFFFFFCGSSIGKNFYVGATKKEGIKDDEQLLSCKEEEEETMDHILFHCPKASYLVATHLCPIWNNVGDAFLSYKHSFGLTLDLLLGRKETKLREQFPCVYFGPFEKREILELLKAWKMLIKQSNIPLCIIS